MVCVCRPAWSASQTATASHSAAQTSGRTGRGGTKLTGCAAADIAVTSTTAARACCRQTARPAHVLHTGILGRAPCISGSMLAHRTHPASLHTGCRLTLQLPLFSTAHISHTVTLLAVQPPPPAHHTPATGRSSLRCLFRTTFTKTATWQRQSGPRMWPSCSSSTSCWTPAARRGPRHSTRAARRTSNYSTACCQ